MRPIHIYLYATVDDVYACVRAIEGGVVKIWEKPILRENSMENANTLLWLTNYRCVTTDGTKNVRFQTFSDRSN